MPLRSHDFHFLFFRAAVLTGKVDEIYEQLVDIIQRFFDCGNLLQICDNIGRCFSQLLQEICKFSCEWHICEAVN
jgi:hypothetical protein